MDKIIQKVAALGVPGLVLLLAISATGYVGETVRKLGHDQPL